MKRSLLGLVVMGVVGVVGGGCGDNVAVAADATIDVRAADAAPPIPCSTAVTSTVMFAGQTYGYAALGNVDAGGESACGGPPEAVMIVLSLDAAGDDPARTQYLQLLLPVAIGSTTTMIYSGAGGAGTSVTLDVTSAPVAGAGPGLAQVAGTFSGAATGQFTAAQCTRLNMSCI